MNADLSWILCEGAITARSSAGTVIAPNTAYQVRR
jgi:hypothetical protein